MFSARWSPMRARRHGHRAEAELPADARLHRRPLLAERGKGAGPAAQHGDEQARRRLAQALDMAQQLVDPDRDLVAEGGRHRVLAVRAAGHRHVGACARRGRPCRQRLADLAQEDRVRLAQHQQIAGLGDVLRGRAPVHPAAVRLADDAAELPHQRHERVAGAREALVDARAVHQLQPRLRGDRLGRFGRNDAEFGLRAGQRDLDVEPGLPAVLQPIERADAGVGDARGGREGVAGGGHGGAPSGNAPSYRHLPPPRIVDVTGRAAQAPADKWEKCAMAGDVDTLTERSARTAEFTCRRDRRRSRQRRHGGRRACLQGRSLRRADGRRQPLHAAAEARALGRRAQRHRLCAAARRRPPGGPQRPGAGAVSGARDTARRERGLPDAQRLDARPQRRRKRPVMVWLHGGGFSYGSANTPRLDGTNLAGATTSWS